MGHEAAPHLSCVGSTRAGIAQILDTYRAQKIRRLVALRGDLPSGTATVGEFRYASELIRFIRETQGDDWHIEVACYPEVHPQQRYAKRDLQYFADKVSAGASSAITQFFFNADAYFHFVDEARKLGVTVPIVPGIMPILNYARIAQFAARDGIEIPRWVALKMEGFMDDAESIRAFGLDVVTHLCRRLIDGGAPGIHFYTLNQSPLSLELLVVGQPAPASACALASGWRTPCGLQAAWLVVRRRQGNATFSSVPMPLPLPVTPGTSAPLLAFATIAPRPSTATGTAVSHAPLRRRRTSLESSPTASTGSPPMKVSTGWPLVGAGTIGTGTKLVPSNCTRFTGGPGTWVHATHGWPVPSIASDGSTTSGSPFGMLSSTAPTATQPRRCCAGRGAWRRCCRGCRGATRRRVAIGIECHRLGTGEEVSAQAAQVLTQRCRRSENRAAPATGKRR